MDKEQDGFVREHMTMAFPHEEIWLLGQPPLADYLHFMRHVAVGGEKTDPRALTDEWRAANDYYHELEEREAGIADHLECGDLDPAMEPLADEVMADARFRNAFDTLPVTIGIVELDRLVIFQPHVTCRFTDALKARLTPKPGPEALFRFCLPLGHPDAPVEIQRVGSRRFMFWSESSDFRFLDPVLLKPEQVRDHDGGGSIAAIVGLTVGFGSNFLNVVRDENRMVLHNGYHRAYALRAAGITHAPCVIQTVTRLDELYVAGAKDVIKNPAFYFKAVRPPVLKDFFDPRIRKVVRTRRVRKMVEVSFEISDFEVTD